MFLSFIQVKISKFVVLHLIFICLLLSLVQWHDLVNPYMELLQLSLFKDQGKSLKCVRTTLHKF